MWLRGFLLLLLSCALPGFAQDRTFGVRNQDGDPVPFVYAVCERTGRYAMSDNRGRMTLRQGDFTDSDTLVFRSMFYLPLYGRGRSAPNDVRGRSDARNGGDRRCRRIP